MAKKRVLIIDDEELSREVISFDLRDTFHCDMAVNAFDAYEKILQAVNNRTPYDIITLDEFMGGGMDGLAFLKIIRICEKYIPSMTGHRLNCVIISGLESEAYLKRMYKITMDDGSIYFKKPFEGGELLKAINEKFS